MSVVQSVSRPAFTQASSPQLKTILDAEQQRISIIKVQATTIMLKYNSLSRKQLAADV